MRIHRFSSRLASILALGLLAGCSAAETESGSRKYDVERYDLQGEFDWGESRLTASVDITLTLGEADISAIELDSKVSVREVRVTGVGQAPFSMDETGGKLVVTLKDVLERAAGESLTLEIDYEVKTGDALRAVAARAGDPVDGRALFTQSEPLGAEEWMPCNDIPSDRALFSVEMRMNGAEEMIANGTLVTDEAMSAGERRMKYETAYPIPPYLMAFAIADFEVETTMKGDLPISIWYRKGLPGDYASTLSELVRLMDRYETLLVPYPFESYSLVLLPGFPVGGMENAGVSFQRETSSAEPKLAGDLNLMAHELAHQWFGDMVTVETWDDVWIKEGMATLLEYEGTRPYLDASNKGTLNGDEFGAYDGSAIRDKTLVPENKYTSGPYSRAAWLFTQIRSLVGEDAFWGTMRSVLESRRFGTVGTEDLLKAFEPLLGKEAAARARLAVDAKAVPILELAPATTEGAMVTLQDPDGALVAPLEVAWLGADGTQRVVKLPPNQPIELKPLDSEEILLIDPVDRHPDWYYFFPDDQNYLNYRTLLRPLRVPRTALGVARFVEIAGIHQRAALIDHLPSVDPSMYTGFVGDLDDEGAKAVSLRAACNSAVATQSSDPMLYDAWVGTLGGALPNELSLFGLSWVSNYDACASVAAPEDLFKSDWAALESGLMGSELSTGRLVYLSKFHIANDKALATWGSTVKSAGSLRARRTAALQLSSYARGLDAASVPVWRDFFVDLLSSSEASEVLDQVIRGVVSTGSKTPSENAKALDALSELLHKEVTRTVHARAVCAAYALTKGDATTWTVFATGLVGAPLSESTASLVKDPSSCR